MCRHFHNTLALFYSVFVQALFRVLEFFFFLTFGICRKGEVIDGSEDDIRATYYMLAFQREFSESDAELRWKVVDMMVIGGE